MRKVDRFDNYMKAKGLNDNKVTNILSLSIGTLGKSRIEGRDLSAKTIEKILNYFNDINPEWLLTGTGPMLKTINATELSPIEKEKDEVLSSKGIVMVPLINLDARGGMLANQVTDVPEYVQGYVPFNADVAKPNDFVMMVNGDSMYPRYPSGSYILLREIPMWREYLELSVPYLIELGDDRRVAKIITKGSDNEHYTLKSVNPEFEDTEISISFIRRVFQIVMMQKKEIV